MRCLLHAHAVLLERDPAGSRLLGVRLRTLTGGTLRAEAQTYVLAVGGIENARLLLLSNDVEPAGLGNGNDTVGRYFMEHIWVRAGVLVASDPASLPSLCLQEIDRPGGWALRTHLVVSEALSVSEGLPLCRVQLGPALPQGEGYALEDTRRMARQLRELRWPRRRRRARGAGPGRRCAGCPGHVRDGHRRRGSGPPPPRDRRQGRVRPQGDPASGRLGAGADRGSPPGAGGCLGQAAAETDPQGAPDRLSR